MVGKDVPKPDDYERSLEHTPTWAVAVVCFVLVVISLFTEHIIHIIGKVSLSIYLNIRLGNLQFLLFVFFSFLNERFLHSYVVAKKQTEVNSLRSTRKNQNRYVAIMINYQKVNLII